MFTDILMVGSYVRRHQVISSAKRSEKDGLLHLKKFFPGSFDRVLLDPPCSALGLRPRLQTSHLPSLRIIKALAATQRKLLHSAIRLLKPGGIMTYSTCTITTMENEGMIRHVLDEYGSQIELVDVGISLGGPGMGGAGLDEEQRKKVRRFDPSDDEGEDTIGFFIAKFRKRLRNG